MIVRWVNVIGSQIGKAGWFWAILHELALNGPAAMSLLGLDWSSRSYYISRRKRTYRNFVVDSFLG